MSYRSSAPFTAVVLGLTVLALMGWMRQAPAKAQVSPVPTAPSPNSQFPMARRMGMMTSGPVSVAASGDYVYVVRGAVLYQFKAAGLGLVAQKDLPTPPSPQAPPVPTGSAPIAPSP